MEQYNAIINCRISNLSLDCERANVRRGHSARFAVKCVPDDVTGVFLRIFKTDGSYFDFPCNYHPNGTWTILVIGTAFPDVGTSSYEVHATDADGNATALALGELRILPFSVTSSPVTAGSTVTVAQVPTADGSMVQIQMVLDEAGQWVYRAL